MPYRSTQERSSMRVGVPHQGRVQVKESQTSHDTLQMSKMDTWSQVIDLGTKRDSRESNLAIIGSKMLELQRIAQAMQGLAARLLKAIRMSQLDKGKAHEGLVSLTRRKQPSSFTIQTALASKQVSSVIAVVYELTPPKAQSVIHQGDLRDRTIQTLVSKREAVSISKSHTNRQTA